MVHVDHGAWVAAIVEKAVAFGGDAVELVKVDNPSGWAVVVHSVAPAAVAYLVGTQRSSAVIVEGAVGIAPYMTPKASISSRAFNRWSRNTLTTGIRKTLHVLNAKLRAKVFRSRGLFLFVPIASPVKNNAQGGKVFPTIPLTKSMV